MGLVIDANVCRLTPRERMVLVMRLQGWSLEQCGTSFGVTRQAVLQIEGRAIRRVRQWYHDKAQRAINGA